MIERYTEECFDMGKKVELLICKIHKGQIFRPTPASHYL